MSVLWIYLAFSLGAMIGFGLFAMLRVARDQDERQKPPSQPPAEDYRIANGC